MFRIHDISVLIRNRMRGSMPLTNRSGSCYFSHKPSRHQQQSIFRSFHTSQNSRNHGFSYYFCLMIEGSGSEPLKIGSGRLKTIRILRIWIRTRIRIRNTAFKYIFRAKVQLQGYWVFLSFFLYFSMIIGDEPLCAGTVFW